MYQGQASFTACGIVYAGEHLRTGLLWKVMESQYVLEIECLLVKLRRDRLGLYLGFLRLLRQSYLLLLLLLPWDSNAGIGKLRRWEFDR